MPIIIVTSRLKTVNLTPSKAKRSMFGVSISLPYAPMSENPLSSTSIKMTFGGCKSIGDLLHFVKIRRNNFDYLAVFFLFRSLYISSAAR